MTRFLVRRIGQMIPTLAGVVVVVFLVFNVVGGSPAEMALGKGASPQALEEFDEVRGFNKPLLAGRWGPTRALAGVERTFPADASGVAPGPADAPLEWPLAFPLKPGTTYRLTFPYRSPAELQLHMPDGVRTLPPTGGAWRTARLVFQVSAGASHAPIRLAVADAAAGGARVGAPALHRRMRHVLDSQFFSYVGRLLRGDLGYSHSEHQRVARILREGIGPTLALTLPMFGLGLVTAVALALYCAWHRNGWVDRFFVVLAVGLMSVNYLVWIVLGQHVLAFRLGWFPVWGFESPACLLLPVLIGVVSGLGADLRLFRSMMLEEIGRDYVRTARAKGATPSGVLWRHVLRNALAPVVTSAVSALPYLYTGSLLLESFFGIPGLGYLGVNAINNADADVVRAIVVIGAVLFMGANLVCDVLYTLIDPRVKAS